MPQKSVLITGTSAGGIGDAIAKSFQKRGYLVFATARNISKIDPNLTVADNVQPISLDVTSQSSIEAAVKLVFKYTGGTLDVLVNNSGAGYTAPALDVDIAKAKAIYDVNFWGVLATTQAFSPLLIKAKGSLVNVSSVSGSMYDGYSSIYNSSKAALTNASEAWRLELAPFGVKVVTVLTGAVSTNFFANVEEYHSKESSLYGSVEQDIRNIEKANGNYMPVELYAEDVVSAVVSGRSGQLWKGGNATIAKLIVYFAPTWILDMVMSRGRGFSKLAAAANN